ncbi:MAG: nuclear transport factor 2 family protein [Gammaproteobacteria bacterium]|nr:nuclear transport factor 2 family protein [Gammaproteobacteria bacterium]MDH5728467.1 nuclear transport factor 2 family protein [Gammaproteobacteria bacterium]
MSDLVINGHQQLTNQTSALFALNQFYHAFNQRNLMAVKQNWWHSDNAIMSNPLGGIKRGWNQIEDVYDRLFHGHAKVFVEFHDFNYSETETCAVFIGRERGWVRSGDVQLDLAIRTSRVFFKIESQWRQVHHHGSIDNAELLANYQKFVVR